MSLTTDLPECTCCGRDIEPGDATHWLQGRTVHAACCPCLTEPGGEKVAPPQDQTMPDDLGGAT